jgi:hypothetical protein
MKQLQLTWGGRTGPTDIYINTEGTGKILTNNFETDYRTDVQIFETNMAQEK